MNEKTGNIVKLEYDFDTARNLEVFMPNLNGWYRVTSREFRSFNGKRRIQGELFKGNIYQFGTNKIINPKHSEENKIAGYKWTSVRRPGENFF